MHLFLLFKKKQTENQHQFNADVTRFTDKYRQGADNDHKSLYLNESPFEKSISIPTMSTTRRPPKTTKEPLSYSNNGNKYLFGLR